MRLEAELYERALTSAAMSFHESAIETLREVTVRAPDHGGAWRKLAELLRLAGVDGEAASARATAQRLGENQAKWPNAVGEGAPARLEETERKLRRVLRNTPAPRRMDMLREHLLRTGLDVVAMRLLAVMEWQEGDHITALALLERALALSPEYIPARVDFARLLIARRRHARALEQTNWLLARLPEDPRSCAMHAGLLADVGKFADAIALYDGLIAQHTQEPKLHLARGNALRLLGRRDDCVTAYRSCLGLAPATGRPIGAWRN